MTKRVSNIAAGIGRHSELKFPDPSTKEQLAQKGTILCRRCRALFHNKHWYAPGKEAAAITRALRPPEADEEVESRPAEIKEGLCPGCHRVEERILGGELVLECTETAKFKESIDGLVRHVEDRCWHDNPASRIVEVTVDDSRIVITTTTDWLATRLGKEIKKAYKGTLKITRSPEESFAQVNWSLH